MSAAVDKKTNEDIDKITQDEPSNIQFFGAVDRNSKGSVSSEMPAWYFDRQMELMQEEITKKQTALDMGFVARDSEGEYRANIEKETKRLDEIKASKPNLSDRDTDVCAKVYKELRTEIAPSMFTREEEHRNFVRPHEEHRINTLPCIKVSQKGAEIAKANGMDVSDKGELSRNNAVRLQMIIGRAIDSDVNIERLRKNK